MPPREKPLPATGSKTQPVTDSVNARTNQLSSAALVRPSFMRISVRWARVAQAMAASDRLAERGTARFFEYRLQSCSTPRRGHARIPWSPGNC